MMEINRDVNEVLSQILKGKEPDRDQLLHLMGCDVLSEDMYALMAAANKLTRELFNNMGEVHAQLGINYAPCLKNCSFCAFAEKHGIANKSVEFSQEEVVKRAKEVEKEGANAIFLMNSADYDFDKYLKMATSALRKRRLFWTRASQPYTMYAGCVRESILAWTQKIGWPRSKRPSPLDWT